MLTATDTTAVGLARRSNTGTGKQFDATEDIIKRTGVKLAGLKPAGFVLLSNGGFPRSISVAILEAPAPDSVASETVTHNDNRLSVSRDAGERATHYHVMCSSNGANAKAARNRAGGSPTITCAVRADYDNQHCVSKEASYYAGI